MKKEFVFEGRASGTDGCPREWAVRVRSSIHMLHPPHPPQLRVRSSIHVLHPPHPPQPQAEPNAPSYWSHAMAAVKMAKKSARMVEMAMRRESWKEGTPHEPWSDMGGMLTPRAIMRAAACPAMAAAHHPLQHPAMRTMAMMRAWEEPRKVYSRNCRKKRMLCAPTQLFTQGQWWCAKGGWGGGRREGDG